MTRARSPAEGQVPRRRIGPPRAHQPRWPPRRGGSDEGAWGSPVLRQCERKHGRAGPPHPGAKVPFPLGRPACAPPSPTPPDGRRRPDQLPARPLATWPESSRWSPTSSPARLSGRFGDRLQVGELVAEEFAGRPAILAVEPAQPTGAGDGQPLEAAVAGEFAAELVPAEAAAVVGVAPASKTSDAIRPAASSRSRSSTGVSPTRKAAVTWSTDPADQRTPKRGSRAVGSHTASAPARPAALWATSGPWAWATVSRPRSFQSRPPVPSR